jgi:hypothetical protein
MNDKYKLLKENPGICKRLFGIEFGDFEIVLGKVEIEFDVFCGKTQFPTVDSTPTSILQTDYCSLWSTCASTRLS